MEALNAWHDVAHKQLLGSAASHSQVEHERMPFSNMRFPRRAPATTRINFTQNKQPQHRRRVHKAASIVAGDDYFSQQT
jgi:hypothetical protein